MIKIIKKAYQVGNQAYASLEEAQQMETYFLLEASAAKVKMPLENNMDVAKWVVSHKIQLIDILTTTPNSRPYRRKINKSGFFPVSQVEEWQTRRVALP